MSRVIKVDSSGLLKWSRFLDELPKRTRPAIAHALNDYGEGVVRATAEEIAGKADLDPSEVLSLIDVKEATESDLTWRMDASQVVPPSQDWDRPWVKRDTKGFEKQTLVNIITVGDEHVCEVCEAAAAHSPYTLAEIDEMVAKWKDFEPATGPAPGFRTNLIHPNCRCLTQQWASKRRVTVRFGTKGAPTELMTARQLGIRVAGEIKVAIRAIKL